jgi:site-specific DNA-cytosine methylase
MNTNIVEWREIRHFHLFDALGGGAMGFNRGSARVGNLQARFRCLGGVEFDRDAIRDFERLTGVKGTVLDLFDREQFLAFNGHMPPAGWREATAADMQAAAGHERPHIVFLSAPCKGFSGLFAVAEITNDCGELGGLAQSRKRFLLVARHQAKVPPFLYEPEKRPLRAVGDLLGRMPLPGDTRGGPMHRIPALQWQTWIRLALVEAGSDWRSLKKLRVKDGRLLDYALIREQHWRASVLGARSWDKPSATISSRGGPTNGS